MRAGGDRGQSLVDEEAEDPESEDPELPESDVPPEDPLVEAVSGAEPAESLDGFFGALEPWSVL